MLSFYDESLPPDKQRYGGFDVGRWASTEELAYLTRQRTSLSESMRPTGLCRDEADFAMALRSVHAVVLTLDAKKGPINTASKLGGNVIFLTDFDESGLSLEQFILARRSQLAVR